MYIELGKLLKSVSHKACYVDVAGIDSNFLMENNFLIGLANTMVKYLKV